MNVVLATIVDGKALAESVIASFIAGVTLTAAFSLLIFGASRFSDMRREERALGAFGAAFVAALGFLITAGAVVFGMVVMLSK